LTSWAKNKNLIPNKKSGSPSMVENYSRPFNPWYNCWVFKTLTDTGRLALLNLLRNYGFLLSLAGIIVFFDQLTKAWVRENIPFGEMWAPIKGLEDYVRIVHWRNTGAAFGMFQDLSIVFTVLAILVSIAILYYYPRIPSTDWPLRLALGLQLGGAVGNLIDRLSIGHVTDFISLFNFAVFNIADASISTGVAVLVIGVWIKDRQQPETAFDPEEEDKQKSGEKNGPGFAKRESLSEEHWGD
jgi:signal peptidase II